MYRAILELEDKAVADHELGYDVPSILSSREILEDILFNWGRVVSVEHIEDTAAV